jgi:hypothetical protein
MELALIGILVLVVGMSIFVVGVLVTWLHDRSKLKKELSHESRSAEKARFESRMRLEQARTDAYRDISYGQGPHGKRQI